MDEVNAKFYVLLNVDTMEFVNDYHVGLCLCTYTPFAHKAKTFPTEELAQKTKRHYKEQDRLVVKEVQVIVRNMP